MTKVDMRFFHGDTIKKIWHTFLVSIPMVFMLSVLTMQRIAGRDNVYRIIFIGIGVIFLVFFILMVYTKKTSLYRRILFIAIALSTMLYTILYCIETRGSIIYDLETVTCADNPQCHLVILMSMLPALVKKVWIFPAKLFQTPYSVASWLTLVIGISLILGRGWCSWVCPHGGFDDVFSVLCRKPHIRISRIWTLLPFAVLLVFIIVSAELLWPVYCEWICPFKAITEYEVVTSAISLIRTIIFVSLFLSLVIILPILTGKRTHCSFLCPFGAFQSLCNKINIFEVRIDSQRCKKCGKCIEACQTLSLDQDSLVCGNPYITCTKCGRCIDVCPEKAISYHIKGVPVTLNKAVPQILFLYVVFIFSFTLGGWTITNALWYIGKYLTEGTI